MSRLIDAVSLLKTTDSPSGFAERRQHAGLGGREIVAALVRSRVERDGGAAADAVRTVGARWRDDLRQGRRCNQRRDDPT
jgi:hypothetical protein